MTLRYKYAGVDRTGSEPKAKLDSYTIGLFGSDKALHSKGELYTESELKALWDKINSPNGDPLAPSKDSAAEIETAIRIISAP